MEKVTTTGIPNLDYYMRFDDQVVTSTGVILIPNSMFDRRLSKPKMKDYQVLFAILPDGTREWLVLKNNQPIHEDTSLEGIACYLDFTNIAEKPE